VDINIQEAWEHAPKKTKCETTHIVPYATEIIELTFAVMKDVQVLVAFALDVLANKTRVRQSFMALLVQFIFED
jgi:hypothetical protein